MNDASTGERKKAFKDYFDQAAARALAKQVRAVFSAFDQRRFVRRATRDLEALAFAARVQQFSDALREGLPDAVPQALAVLTESLPDPLPDCAAVTDGWLQWPVGQFIADHGLPHFDASMAAMVALTQRFSSEFAVRPFVEHRPDETFARLRELTGHESPHVRRWCSEGTRPRLPWGRKLRALVADPRPLWPILEALKADPERYVQRSVANNLNDIAKDHPDAVVERCRRWGRKPKPETRWVIQHALRSLVKDGHPSALDAIGFAPPVGLTATLSIRPVRVAIGGAVELHVALRSEADRAQALVVDYSVHYVRKGNKSSPKVFKWTRLQLEPGDRATLDKRHPMRPTTIRALYPGRHRVEVQVNGVVVADGRFTLAASATSPAQDGEPKR